MAILDPRPVGQWYDLVCPYAIPYQARTNKERSEGRMGEEERGRGVGKERKRGPLEAALWQPSSLCHCEAQWNPEEGGEREGEGEEDAGGPVMPSCLHHASEGWRRDSARQLIKIGTSFFLFLFFFRGGGVSHKVGNYHFSIFLDFQLKSATEVQKIEKTMSCRLHTANPKKKRNKARHPYFDQEEGGAPPPAFTGMTKMQQHRQPSEGLWWPPLPLPLLSSLLPPPGSAELGSGTTSSTALLWPPKALSLPLLPSPTPSPHRFLILNTRTIPIGHRYGSTCPELGSSGRFGEP